FLPIGGPGRVSSFARIIATTTSDLSILLEKGEFDKLLHTKLCAQIITIPPLHKRKADLGLIVDYLIEKNRGEKTLKGIDSEAYQHIMAYDWPGNLDELEVVLRRAINLAQHEYLMPEDIFIGLAPAQGKYTFNLFHLRDIQKMFLNNLFPKGLQIIAAGSFLLILLSALFGPQSANHNVSVIIIWGIWWPFLVLSWFLGARGWCAVCPMGALNDLMNNYCSLSLKVPPLIRNYGIHLSAVGLGIIVWVESATHMPYSPNPTAYLLLTITAFALLSGLLFQRRVWCRYLCPLGKLGGTFASASAVEWRANTGICNSKCKTHGCYLGNETVNGCPMYGGPFSLRNSDCILCGNCMKICTEKAPVFNLRLPGHELTSVRRPDIGMKVFIPFILGIQLFRGFEHADFIKQAILKWGTTWGVLAVLLIAAIGFAFLFCTIAGKFAFKELKNPGIYRADLFKYAILPLALAFEIAYHLASLYNRATLSMPILGNQLGFDLNFLDFSAILGAVALRQVFIITAGAIASCIVLNRLASEHEQEEARHMLGEHSQYLPVLLLALVHFWIFIAMKH
ncbi:4Fe-4S binding protein, partial [Candidatus Riflebacteria bacterium]